MASKIQIGIVGIKRTLEKFDTYASLAEYVWNGFDANASNVDIVFLYNQLGGLQEVQIVDNGTGIDFQLIDKKFTPFLHTDKAVDPFAIRHGPSAVHGKSGIGRLTFYKFAKLARWETTFQTKHDRLNQYNIQVAADSLDTYDASAPIEVEGHTGTIVHFFGFTDLEPPNERFLEFYLEREFAWFIELSSPFKRTITINGRVLKYENLVGERENKQIAVDGKSFAIRFVRWEEKLHDEYSRYYFIGSDNVERAKQHTTFNNKGDGFYHSLYVSSDFFDNFSDFFLPIGEAAGSEVRQPVLTTYDLKHEETYRSLIKELETFLKHKRKPYVRKQAIKYVENLDVKGLLPKFSNDVWDQHNKNDLKEILREVYEIDPRLFGGLSNQQTQTMVQLFCIIMSSAERDDLLDVLSQVVRLDQKERADLAKILRTTQLSNVIATIKLIEDRITAVDELKKMVFNPSFQANERDNLQTHIERHYWLFGEKYHLVTSAEPDFEEALRRYTYILRGENKTRKIEHKDRNKEMDIFMVRCLPEGEIRNHVVVELKHPSITLGMEEFNQVRTYMDVIQQQPEFNGNNQEWEFYLIGNDYDHFIVGNIKSMRNHGLRNLAHAQDNYKIFVYKWSEIFTNFELRHNFLIQKLKFERDKLATKEETADDIIVMGKENTAIQEEVIIPHKISKRKGKNGNS